MENGRYDGRKNDELRKVTITRDYTKYAEGSVLIEMGDTKVLCTASVDDKVPPFRKGTGKDGLQPNMICCRAQRPAGIQGTGQTSR